MNVGVSDDDNGVGSDGIPLSGNEEDDVQFRREIGDNGIGLTISWMKPVKLEEASMAYKLSERERKMKPGWLDESGGFSLE
ncbi:hypothetical protein L6452_31249 [Arctium lappa]|uniref:Uncharacterized protein n=1 Tax=Arctium lappa TaxID=4217 RepID=A0ACB8ZJE3_ARCLA|nr:hypothetical protein L6452_31249 [Arctium lappa]